MQYLVLINPSFINHMMTQEAYEQLITKTWQQSKEDLTLLLEGVYPKEEIKASFNAKVQAMYENLIALRTVAMIPHHNNNSL